MWQHGGAPAAAQPHWQESRARAASRPRARAGPGRRRHWKLPSRHYSARALRAAARPRLARPSRPARSSRAGQTPIDSERAARPTRPGFFKFCGPETVGPQPSRPARGRRDGCLRHHNTTGGWQKVHELQVLHGRTRLLESRPVPFKLRSAPTRRSKQLSRPHSGWAPTLLAPRQPSARADPETGR